MGLSTFSLEERPHSNLFYTAILPRKIANFTLKLYMVEAMLITYTLSMV